MGPANDSRLSGELDRAKRERSGQADRDIIKRGEADAAAGSEPPTAGITPGLGEIANAKRAREKRAADAAAAVEATKKKALEESAREKSKAKK